MTATTASASPLEGFDPNPGGPPWIIAEAGVNHNGDEALAMRLVDVAKDVGADCVKFQTFKAERLAIGDAPKAAYQLQTTDPGESQQAMLRSLELPVDAYKRLMDRCRQRGITFLSTPYNIEDVDMLEELGVELYKVASGQTVEPQMLRRLARTGKPLIVSTGMCDLAEVAQAVNTLADAHAGPVVLLQCATNYPASVESSNLRAMRTMAQAFGLPVGFSDHTVGISAAIAAAALGSAVIERHFTLDTKMDGPDHAASSDPEEFARMVQGVREAHAALGDGIKIPCPEEVANTPGMRRSLVAARDIAKGAVIGDADITCKRPGTGLKPVFVDLVLGRTPRKDIAAGAFIDLADIE